MLKTIPNLKTVEFVLNKGMHELLPSNRRDGYACLQQNWRTSADATRIEKRLGVATEVSDFGEDVYGYHTYIDGDSNFCQIAVLESQIKRKVGAAAWGSIHTFSSSISHPVKVLDIQGKQFIINEVDSRFVHTDGNDYQIGIAAPTTLADVHILYETAIAEVDCSSLAGWTEDNTGTGDTTQVAFDGKTCFKQDAPAGAGTTLVYKDFTSPAPGKRFTIECKIYLEEAVDLWYLEVAYTTNDRVRFSYYASDNSFDMTNKALIAVPIAFTPAVDTWYTIKLYVDAENESADVYINGTYYGTYDIAAGTGSSSLTAGRVTSVLNTNAKIIYIDYINLYNSEDTTNSGSIHRYGITHARSENFGNESNPILSKINTPFFKGSGLNDLTAAGTYTGDISRTIYVRIDGTGTPDTAAISYDAMKTWNMIYVPLTGTIYLSYGVILTFAATTGHTSGDTWVINCRSMSVRRTMEEDVYFSAIPVSGDAQVDTRKIYRSVFGGATFFWMSTIANNTSTTYYEKILDLYLGTEVEQDHDVMPNGKYPVWWDNRLWVFASNTAYYSALDNPEAFDTDTRYITIRAGEEADEITGAIEYKDILYVFKRNAIYIIMKKEEGDYGRYPWNKDVGCDAPSSLIEVNDLLMFKSQRGIELYNGITTINDKFSIPVLKTIKAIDKSKLDYITSTHMRMSGEVCFSLPDLSGHWTTITQCVVVYNYLADCWYLFHYPDGKKISCMVECRTSTGELVNKIGTRDGYLGLAESGYTDFGAAIVASYYSEHATFPEGCDIGFAEFEYECLADKYLSIYWYADMNDTAVKDDALLGSTPTGQYADMYRLEYRPVELGLRAKNLQMLIYNAQNPGGAMKVNKALVYYHPRRVKGSYSGQ
uniref:Putative structural protein n=1 Tax=viral metagenome TaxID=1070528 RepID=A0A6M3IZK1_9ZZZZ